MKNRPAYFDYAATTPLDPRVLAVMQRHLTLDACFGNPASLHAYGREAMQAVDHARLQVATSIGALPSEIIFTSGATESNNLAIKGAMALYQRKGRHLITFKTEHKAVLDPAQQLEKEGCLVTYLNPLPDGSLDFDALQKAITPETVLVSLMHINNETGVVNDIARAGELTRRLGVLLHVDAAQSIGKCVLNVNEVQADLISLSAHKAYGPKGVGALYLRKKPRVRVHPFIQGGGQEQGMRSGTLATHQIAGMGEAFALAVAERETECARIQVFNDHLMAVVNGNPRLHLNAASALRVPHILNIQFESQLADAILENWPDIAASTAAACQGKSIEGSHVLRAMGLTAEQVKSSIRFSMGRFTTEIEVNKLKQALMLAVSWHRTMPT
ncbi:MAG TPA: aminotransferase class V-fold PLP-dependent enzyme [Gammaproteobacteria bacterium]|nr:aminotransferase class V-fold PLP-dependent enzyme [Gammaproteobacteria bacterium]